MTVEEAGRLGFLHLQKMRKDKHRVLVRFSKPLLRLLLQNWEKAVPFSDAKKNLGQNLPSLLKTCRDYHGDVEEAVQLLSLATARAAYVLLTPASRPELASLEGLRPGARAYVSKAKREALKRMAEALKMEAAAVDEQTAGELDEYNKTKCHVTQLRTRDLSLVENKNALSDALVNHKAASGAYIKARLDAYKKTTAYALHRRGQPLSYKDFEGVTKVKVVHRETSGGASLTQAKATGVDAWMYFGKKVYAMQCKGQETGAGAGQAGGDATFASEHVKEVLGQFAAWLKTDGADFENVAALELLTTKRMTEVSKDSANDSEHAVVVVARDVLPSALGLVWGDIAARCMESGNM